ncbi:MAG TPA: hypothetical protein DIS53_01455 [Candidatus Wildermuthbacteria bacterium]|uniref:DUF11 domain-containing protein n=1 Tax=Candidatus Yanofskybacteria bacterium GW2011_GWC1_48_11 TaxID=1619027 RepID=A0A837IN63_9BACT|nr:MAG: hypothetical protein UY25_C0001G0041 [Candidatus Yanofskybacteria bacterium GW2011_GWC1_48_11]KKW03985.1 MAG: hypothetical protein UY38_C0002G0139 [Parcubacteria group bacterium GW2011_GWB1_49_12]KKW08913.1 MAG: hypothetical protein UY45_C0003G0120 [Parcubacteria group bacterium GW2011_GWA1_49_26]KKW13886.1 MAG: hypothetical protein UY53_C0005G0010 [Parcubacteria group bacterium GW2011_GWA2_50_10]OHA61829.1 MAG: hypothetical protein A2109_00600 [Candidatus Wildermuthbacteria bacterium G
MRLKIVYGVLFVAAALSVAGFWVWQKNIFSTGDVRLEILAPDAITVGEEVTYVVRWRNVGDTQLVDASLTFDYPEGAIPSEGSDARVIRAIDTINPGQEDSARFSARLFGKENEIKEARASLTYTPRNLSASFRSETSASSKISFVPLNFDVNVPSRMEADQQFEIELNYFSNSEYPLSDLRIQMQYPDGFSFRSASPVPLGDNEWDIGVLNRTEGGRITVRGALEGGVQEVKIFRAVIGSWKDGRFTVMREVQKGVQIARPQLLIAQQVNSSANYVASAGDVLHYEISFRNPTDRILENLSLLVTLDGRAFDLDSLKANSGRFQRGSNSLVWEPRDNTRLRFLGRGEEGRVEFWVNVKDDIETFSPQDQGLTLQNRVLLSEASMDFEVKLRADLRIEQRGFFSDEVFGNTGPHPPTVGQRTTYTVIWRATNKLNDVRSARVKAALPQGAELTGNIFPANSNLTFDSASRELVWEIGDLAAGTGVFPELQPPSVAFQIAFTPTPAQRGRIAELVGQARITGEDLFVDQVVSSTDDPIDTRLPDDSSVSGGMGIVQ